MSGLTPAHIEALAQVIGLAEEVGEQVREADLDPDCGLFVLVRGDLPDPDAIPRLTPGSHEWKAARAAGWGGSPDDEPRDWSGYDEDGIDHTPGMDLDYYLRAGDLA
jgi:hypothetical protein